MAIKVFRVIIIVPILLIMLLATLLDYSVKHSLVAGSIDSMESIASMPVVFPATLLGAFIILLCWYFKSPNTIKLICLGACFCLWALSGRMVSVIPFQEGRLNAGWFNISTNEFYLCKSPQHNCDGIFLHETQMENLSFWRIRIKNENIEKIIFVGPFIWNQTQKLFTDKVRSETLSIRPR